MEVQIGAIWRIQLNDLCSESMRPAATITVATCYHFGADQHKPRVYKSKLYKMQVATADGAGVRWCTESRTGKVGFQVLGLKKLKSEKV